MQATYSACPFPARRLSVFEDDEQILLPVRRWTLSLCSIVLPRRLRVREPAGPPRFPAPLYRHATFFDPGRSSGVSPFVILRFGFR